MKADTLPAVCGSTRIVLAGDKISPLESKLSKKGQQALSIMDLVIENKKNFSWIMFWQQYRSNWEIAEWSNKTLYEEMIYTACNQQPIANTSQEKGRKIFDSIVLIDILLENQQKNQCSTNKQDTAESLEEYEMDWFSYTNDAESKIAVRQYQNLIEIGVAHENIAVITPYSGQVKLITEGLRKSFENEHWNFNVGTVDSFQGQEFDAVVCSLVRTNYKLNTEFVTDLWRLNETMTRAKKHFMLIANGFILMKHHTRAITNLYTFFVRTERRLPPSHVFFKPSKNETNRFTNNKPVHEQHSRSFLLSERRFFQIPALFLLCHAYAQAQTLQAEPVGLGALFFA